MPVQPNDYALVIGIDDYPNYGSNGRPLNGAQADAKEIWQWLTDKETGGGVRKKHARLILSSMKSVDPPQPRHGTIDDALADLWEAAQKNGAPRRFYFYFSGHGQTQDYDDVALCLANWAQNRQGAALSFKQYLKHFVECMNFQEVVVLLDCCRSQKIGALGQKSELTCAKAVAGAGATRIFTTYATTFQTMAFEGPGAAAPGGDEPIVRGYFTAALLAALKGHAAQPAGGVTASQLQKYLRTVVPRLAKRGGYNQSPDFGKYDALDGDAADAVFGAAMPVATANVRITFSPNRQGAIKLEGPDLALIYQGDVTTGPWDQPLHLATFMLTEVATGAQLTFNLKSETAQLGGSAGMQQPVALRKEQETIYVDF